VVFLPTMYQLGFDFHAAPPTFASNKSGLGRPESPKPASAPAPRDPAEILRTLGTQPDTSIHDFDVGEDVRLREVGLLCLRCLIGVRSERADVNQACNSIIDSGACDDGSAVGVADEDNRAADPADRCLHQGNVLCHCVEAVLGCNTLITLRLKGTISLLKHEPSAQSP